MVVVMTGSPLASAYPGASAEKWAKDAQKDMAKSKERTAGFEELRQQKLGRKQKQDAAKAKAKAQAEAAFQKRNADRKASQTAERALRARVRGESLTTIQTEHESYLADERKLEKRRLEMARMRIGEQGMSVLPEDQMEAILDAGDVHLRAEIAKEADDQRKLVEEQRQNHEAEEKAERERKAKEKEMEAKAARDGAARKERDENYRIKKEMAAKTRQEQDKESLKEAEMKKRRNTQRKQNDEYDAWLGKGDLLRDEEELMNERREGSAMHKGGRFSGIPDMVVDGKGNQ